MVIPIMNWGIELTPNIEQSFRGVFWKKSSEHMKLTALETYCSARRN
jgi:hypothetical protein